jgi:hypothetical protein
LTARKHCIRLGCVGTALVLLLIPGIDSATAKPVAAQLKGQGTTGRGMTGKPWAGTAGVKVTTAQIMARARHVPRHLKKGSEPEEVDREGLPSNPSSSETPGHVTTPGSPATGFPVSSSFLGAQVSDSGYVPPDSMGAVGPSQFLVTVNGRIRVFDKSSFAVGSLNTTMNAFFGPVGVGTGTSDPRVRYDPQSGRWYVVMITVDEPNKLLIAVSNGPTITAGTVWTEFGVQQDLIGTTPNSDTNNFADFPTLGIDGNALYIGANVFNGNTFVETSAFVVRKSSVVSGGPIVITAFRGLAVGTGDGPWTPQGVDDVDASSSNGYFVGVSNAAFGRLVLRRVSDPGGTPTISANILLTVPATRFPLNVPSAGGVTLLDGVDDRLGTSTLRNGVLWTAHNIGVNSSGVASSPDRTGIRWYKLGGLDTTPALVSSGTVFDSAAASPRYYWMPSVMPTGQGHVGMGMSTAGALNFADAASTAMLASELAFSAPSLYTSSSSAYNINDGRNPHRWGDYSMTSLDPCDQQTLWTIQEYTNATNSWGVQVGKALAPPPATPATPSPSSVPAGQASVIVNLTGTSSAGSGFFDTGSGSCRLQGAVTNGVSVNSVTFTDATHVTLDLNTTGATAGTANVTITNPDGQSSTGSGILTITSPGAVTLAPSSLSFGSVPVASNSAPQTFKVQNTGTTPFKVASLGLTGANPGDFSIVSQNCLAALVTVGSFCSITVRARPTAVGTRTANVEVGDTAPGGPHNEPLTVTGTPATPSPAVLIWPTSWNFGSVAVGTQSTSKSFLVTNKSSASLVVSSVGLAGANPGDFLIVSENCTGTIAPGGSCTITTAAKPTTTGARSANVRLDDNAPNTPQLIPLSVTGS